MEQSGEQLEDLPLTFDGDSNGVERFLSVLELFRVVDAGNGEGIRSALIEVVERRGVVESERLAFRGRSSSEELVEDVVVPLRFGLIDETGSLEKIRSNSGADDGEPFVEEDLPSAVVSIQRLGKQSERLTSMYFPNLDELSFLVVLAFPNASMIGFVARICSSVSLIPLLVPTSDCRPL